MKRLFGKLVSFFHNHPGIKTAAVAVGGTVLSAAGSGSYGTKGAVVAGAIGAVVGLFTKRPQDGAGQ
jgi:hypothetical protein